MSSLPTTNTSITRPLPFWTWLVPLPILFLGTLMSLQAKITTGTSLFYFPIPFALTMMYWWGPRVLPGFYVNAVACAGLWDLERVELWPLYGLPEVLFVFLSWVFFVKLFSGKVWLPNTKQIVYFLIYGILLPLIIYKLVLESIFLLAGDAPSTNYWNLFFTTGLGDFISTFCVSIPLLYFLTKFMQDKGLALCKEKIDPLYRHSTFSRLQWLELIGVAFAAYLINTLLSFSEYWFLNGILSLLVAMRFGFGATVLMNSYILLITYVVPATSEVFAAGHFLGSDMFKTQLGTALLYVFTIITGRLVSDMRMTEKILYDQNKDLSKMNAELDRFVYSVSHDISAPLKSILGVVNISKLTNKENEHRNYFELIERSVHKLEHFVSDVLDYSRNKRSEVVAEELNVKSLAKEVYEDLKFMNGFDDSHLDLDGITHEFITTDKTRLKIILQNLFSNAIKFRQRNLKSYIKVSTSRNSSQLTLIVADNGQGIPPEFLPQIFNMFFRGSDRSHGAGLGLYIAQESAKAVGASIGVESKVDNGTVFTITFQKF